MGRATKGIMIVAAALAIVGAGAVAGYAVTGNDDDAPLTGSSYDQATTAAVQAAGGGTVTETEAGDDGSFEVEVRRPDGSQVEVNLDGAFKVTATEADDNDDAGDDDGPGDDQDEPDDADDGGDGADDRGEPDD